MSWNAPLLDILDVMRRRAALILGIVILGFAGSLYLGLGQRPVFQSVEMLRIAPPRLAPELVATTVSESLERQLPGLRRHLTSDAVLRDIIVAYELFDTDTGSMQSKTDRLRDGIAIDWVIDPNTGQSDISVIARLADAQSAQSVAQEISHRLIKASVQQRIAEARATLDFLIEAEQTLQADLWTLQSRYSAFRQDNIDLLEGGESLRQSEMTSLSQALVAIEREKILAERQLELATDTGERAAIEELLATNERQRAALAIKRDALARDMLVPSGFIAEVRGYERELDRIREDLAKASAKRTLGEAGLDVETRRQSERIVVTEPAVLALRPVIDTRGVVIALGGAVSAILAIVIALIVDMRNPVMRTAAQMQRQTGITPIATIPFRGSSVPKSGGRRFGFGSLRPDKARRK